MHLSVKGWKLLSEYISFKHCLKPLLPVNIITHKMQKAHTIVQEIHITQRALLTVFLERGWFHLLISSSEKIWTFAMIQLSNCEIFITSRYPCTIVSDNLVIKRATSWDYGTFRPPYSFFKRACAIQWGDFWFLVGPFVNFHTSCMRTFLARLRGCEGSPDPSPVAIVISTIISWQSLMGKLSESLEQILLNN